MGSMSLMHWMVVLAIVLVLFGAGKLPRVMGDFAKGIKAFKAGMKEEDEPGAANPTAQVAPPSGATTATMGPTGATAGIADRPHEHA
ncbi:MAG TPA: twin-arginine translocase TatA/TatE family subunit [Stellaceae bacterium]|jgi:sec-independent protein translocase protein TatA|nr:twin-arginine translocase TatA/TatE family subunit [Stellaceae bacterium]